jgi:hypothetical protein
MDSENIPADLRDAFRAMQQQIEAAHATWIKVLAEHSPALADQLRELYNHYCAKHERLQALLLLAAVIPARTASNLRAAYEALDSIAATSTSREADDHGEENSAEFGPRQRAAQTKRNRTRKALLDAALDLIIEGDTARLVDESAARAGVSVKTLYNHFSTKNELLAAAYKRLLEPLLSQI